MSSLRLLALSTLSLLGAAPAPRAEALPPSVLSLHAGGEARVWWRSDRAPARWSADVAPLARTVRWRAAAPGVEWAELEIGGSGEAMRTRVAVARLDPRRVRFDLDTAFARSASGRWTIDRAREGAAFAVNAGQFVRSRPWGWLVLDGRQRLAPGRGPLSAAFVVGDSASGAAGPRIVGADSLKRLRPSSVRIAFQSYPVLLAGGRVTDALLAPGRGVDVAHRDARAAIGLLDDGRVIVALTRFDLLGPSFGFVPFGLTAPEMAAVMGALGARDALMLDGGISAQMLVRDAREGDHRWHGVRPVPLALVASPRQ